MTRRQLVDEGDACSLPHRIHPHIIEPPYREELRDGFVRLTRVEGSAHGRFDQRAQIRCRFAAAFNFDMDSGDWKAEQRSVLGGGPRGAEEEQNQTGEPPNLQNECLTRKSRANERSSFLEMIHESRSL